MFESRTVSCYYFQTGTLAFLRARHPVTKSLGISLILAYSSVVAYLSLV